MNKAQEIVKLDETVINRIAAGEVVQRPASALKELIENCLDAHASSIQVTVKEGGIKLLQIQDNGTGIRKQDLEIVCERFTTSKLQKFEDLNSLTTYGFRGEALASISHVAHLTIITKTADEKCAYRVSYEDGKWKAPPVPCGGNQGTQIIVENLFYNVSTRHKMLKNTSEEFLKISEVVSRYAIHNSQVGFALKKYGDDEVSIKTLPKSTTVDNIRTIYGSQVAKELKEVKAEDEMLKFKFRGHITNLNYRSNKLVFLLFINHRLVESDALKKELDQLYTTYLPTGTHPFLYLSLELDPKNLDVNVHPTKHTVCFLHEEVVVRKIKAAVQRGLLGDHSSRSYQLQPLLPNSGRIPISKDSPQEDKDKSRIYAHQKVRTSTGEQKLDKFYGSPVLVKAKDANLQEPTGQENTIKAGTATPQPEDKTFKITEKRREFNLSSLVKLRAMVESQAHNTLKEVLSGFTFVGCVDPDYALIQHNTDLYLCNTTRLSEELFYQIMLKDFGNFGVIKFTSPMSLQELVLLALESDSAKSVAVREEQARHVSGVLVKQANMLEDYFSMEIDSGGNLLAIPILLKQYFPDMACLPEYIVRIGTTVNWQNEQECFDNLCRETAYFYSRPPPDDSERDKASDKDSLGMLNGQDWRWTTEHVIYPTLKKNLLPPSNFVDNRTMVHIARIEDLYSVFERC